MFIRKSLDCGENKSLKVNKTRTVKLFFWKKMTITADQCSQLKNRMTKTDFLVIFRMINRIIPNDHGPWS